MAATVLSDSSGGTATGNVAVPLPAGTTDGDLLVAVGFQDPDGGTFNAPAGWTLKDTSDSPTGLDKVWWKRASGEPASYTWQGDGNASSIVFIDRIDGAAETGDPFDGPVGFGGDTGNATAHVAPSVTLTAGSLLLCADMALVSSNSATTTFTPPPGMTEAEEAHGGSSWWIAGTTAYQSDMAGGATGTKTFTCSLSRPYRSISAGILSAQTATPPNTGTAAGVLPLTGTATGTAPAVPVAAGSASGVLALAGSAAGTSPAVAPASGAASGTLALTGSATGTAPMVAATSGATTGALPLAGSAVGATGHRGSTSGALGLDGAATGTAGHRGEITGSLPLTGTATGTAPLVGATGGSTVGSLPLTGAATGSTGHAGQITGRIPLAGSASGSRAVSGQATGSLRLAGYATGANGSAPGRDLTIFEAGPPTPGWTTTSPDKPPRTPTEPALGWDATAATSGWTTTEPVR